MTSINLDPTSCFSSGSPTSCCETSPLVNDSIEAPLIQIELALNKAGKLWVVSILSGAARDVFGAFEIVGALAFTIIRGLSTPICLCKSGRGEALLACAETMRASTYMVHGLANIMRGTAEIFQLCTRSDEHRFQYPSEQKRISFVPTGSHVSILVTTGSAENTPLPSPGNAYYTFRVREEAPENGRGRVAPPSADFISFSDIPDDTHGENPGMEVPQTNRHGVHISGYGTISDV